MKIPSKISQSRHGIYYFHHQFIKNGKRKESRISLNTKNPLIAREKSLLISAMMAGNKMGEDVGGAKMSSLDFVGHHTTR